MFDIGNYRNLPKKHDRYDRRINALRSSGKDTQFIESTVEEALHNLKDGTQSFVIYGEPQSGKTEMMIVLTARLLDQGYKLVIVLLKDDIQLLNQNLDRFRRSGIDPTPVNVSEILEEEIGNKEWIIFCKKNNKELKKIIDKLYNKNRKIIIDDEADYASPNAKINREERTAINESINALLGSDGIYIGVTATPARLDLNNTFDNITEKWINFSPHKDYVGKDVFFPMNLIKPPEHFQIEFLPDQGDDPEHLRKALLSFLANVSYININNDIKTKLKIDNEPDVNFCFLIHTSGKTADHRKDQEIVIKVFDILSNQENKDFEKYVNLLFDLAKEKYGDQYADEITKFVLKNISRKTVVVMNSTRNRKIDTDPTNPPSLFTVAIGGNIVSRGVTFNNLLGMFFTRDVKHKMQQDTYIQRARMFGNRVKYLHFFELWIPEYLYLDWHRCFVYHYLSLEAIKTDKWAPIWITDERVNPVAAGSVDKKAVVTDSGEMFFSKFRYSERLEKILGSGFDPLRKLEIINEEFGGERLPLYIINFIKSFGEPYEGYIAIHKLRSVGKNSKDPIYHDSLYRKRGVMGGQDIAKFPQAIHHIMVLTNAQEDARIVYRYKGNVRYLKNLKNKNV